MKAPELLAGAAPPPAPSPTPERRSGNQAPPSSSGQTLFGFPGPTTNSVVADDIHALLFALSTGAVALLLILRPHVAAGITEADEQRTYALAWPAALAAALMVPAAVKFVERKWVGPSTLFWPLMGICHTALWLCAVERFRLIDAARGPLRGEALAGAFRWTAVGHAVLTIALLASFVIVRSRSAPGESRLARRKEPIGAIGVALAIAGLAWIVIQFSQTSYDANTIGAFIVVAAILLLARGTPTFSRTRLTPLVGDGLVLAGLVLLLWFPEIGVGARVGPRGADIWVDHYNFYLGPVAAVLGGRSPLVDANSQYGIGVIYFIALLFRLRLFESSNYGLAHLICFLEVMRSFVLYLTMRRLTGKPLVAFLFLCTSLAISIFWPLLVYITLPSVGPLRFIIEYALVAAIAFQDTAASSSRRSSGFGVLLVVAIGSLWSVDTAITVIGAHLGTRALVALGAPEPLLRRAIRFSRDAALTAVAVGAGVLALTIHVRATTGAWPIWDHAIRYILFYRTWAGWTVPIEPWAMWLPTGLVYLGSFVAIARRADRSPEAQAIFAMTLVGIAEMNYYIGRSYSGNLAVVSVPAVFVGCYWMAVLLERTRGVLRLAVGTAGYAAAMMLIFTGLPGFVSKLPFSLLMYSASAKKAPPRSHSPEATEAAALFRKYAPHDRRIAVFLKMDVEVEALLMTRRTQMWPLAYVEQDNLLPEARNAALAFKPPLHVGDTIFVGQHLSALQSEIVRHLTHDFALTEVETTPLGIKALRMSPGSH
jgi:hypothetical protein